MHRRFRDRIMEHFPQFAALDYEMPDQVFMSGKLNEYLKVRFVIHTL